MEESKLPLGYESYTDKAKFGATSALEAIGSYTRSARNSIGSGVTNLKQTITWAMRRDELQLYQQYCILEGLSLFAMADSYRKAPEVMAKAGQNKFDFAFEEKGDVTMTMKHIKVKEFEEWGELKADYYNELSNSFCELLPGSDELQVKPSESKGWIELGLTKLMSINPFGQTISREEIDKIPLVAQITWH